MQGSSGAQGADDPSVGCAGVSPEDGQNYRHVPMHTNDSLPAKVIPTGLYARAVLKAAGTQPNNGYFFT